MENATEALPKYKLYQVEDKVYLEEDYNTTDYFPISWEAKKFIEAAMEGKKEFGSKGKECFIKKVEKGSTYTEITFTSLDPQPRLYQRLLLNFYEYKPRYEFIGEVEMRLDDEMKPYMFYNYVLNRVPEHCFGDRPYLDIYSHTDIYYTHPKAVKKLHNLKWVRRVLDIINSNTNGRMESGIELLQTWDKPMKLDFRKRKHKIEFYSSTKFEELIEFFRTFVRVE